MGHFPPSQWPAVEQETERVRQAQPPLPLSFEEHRLYSSDAAQADVSESKRQPPFVIKSMNINRTKTQEAS